MNQNCVAKNFKESLSEEFTLIKENTERFRIFTPFRFDDGDHLSIVLKRDIGLIEDPWIFSDEGDSEARKLFDSTSQDLERNSYEEIVNNVLEEFQIKNRKGELLVKIEGVEYADALFRLIQAILRISSISVIASSFSSQQQKDI